MLLRAVGLALSGALLAGCAAQPNEPTFSADNPANPSAAEAPLPPESQTLAIQQNAPPSVAEQEPAKQLQPQMPQLQQGMGGMTHHHGMAGMQHQAPSTQPGDNAAVSAPRWTPTTAPTTTAAAVYTCPMHPQVRSEMPGKCPICRMKLVPAQSGDHANHSGHGGQP